MRRLLKKLGILVVALFALLIVAMGTVCVAGAILGRSTPFNEEGWKTGDRRLRWRMAQDPEFTPRLIGLTEEALQQRLGQPDNSPVAKHPPLDKIYFYWIDKPLDPFRWNLEIWIEKGRVTKVFISD